MDSGGKWLYPTIKKGVKTIYVRNVFQKESVLLLELLKSCSFLLTYLKIVIKLKQPYQVLHV